ncbi:Ppx/GppA family phosphatase [Neobacillus cucumis]|uniref:Ppx/GppA family phosphatase n=1 Tax=Neobacillus cucumis TaxID=1740721 RepID=UPI0015E0E4BD|nr:Ppx/GppA family phosphatase [Neobacillus cucumis]
MKEKVAIIDIGSNTIRLVIYKKRKNGKQFKKIENIKKTTRLRSYLNDEQSLDQEGISLLIETLLNFQTMIGFYEVSEPICVATATIRQAKNKEDILQLIQEKTGLVVHVLGEYEEAYYGYLAVVNSIDILEGITIDLGGGSTELTYFNNRKLLHHASLPFGALSLKLQFIKGEIPTDQELVQIRQFIGSHIEKIPWIIDKQIPIIAMGGSARNLAQLHQRIHHLPPAGIHKYEIKIPEINGIKEKLKSLSFTELQNTEGLSKDRADTILLAIEVFEILCLFTSATKFISSGKGLREGVLYSHLNKRASGFTNQLLT